MRQLKEALIGSHNIKNVGLSPLKKDSSQISYNDIKPGMVVEVTDKKRETTTRYIGVRYKDCVLDVIDDDSDRIDIVLLTPRDTDVGFSFWSLKDFKRMFPYHYMWPNDVYISNVWMTNIDTKKLDVDALRKVFKRTVNTLD